MTCGLTLRTWRASRGVWPAHEDLAESLVPADATCGDCSATLGVGWSHVQLPTWRVVCPECAAAAPAEKATAVRVLEHLETLQASLADLRALVLELDREERQR